MDIVNTPTSTATSQLCTYASGPSGPNFLITCLSKQNTVIPTKLTATNVLLSTNLPEVTVPKVVPGEQAYYNFAVDIPEGTGTFTFTYPKLKPLKFILSPADTPCPTLK